MRLGERALGAGEATLGALLRFARLRRVLVRLRALLRQRDVLGRKPVHDAGRIGDQRFLALKIARELRQAPREFRLALLGALLFRFERLAGERDAMQGRAASRFLVAQGRQGGGGERLQTRGLALRARALGDFKEVGVEPPARLGERRLMFAPGDKPRERLLAADRAGEFAIAVRLARLPLEAVDLGVDLLQHILDAGEVVLGALEPELGFVPSRVEAGDAGRLLQNQPARLGLGGNDLADLTLSHQRGRARAGRSVGEQELHVARAHLLAIDAVGRTVSRSMRRVTSSVSESLNAAGARRSELLSTSPTSALLREGRRPEPAKMTSSMPEARMFLNELSPITQRRASTRFDLPQPFGPTTPVNPGSILNSALSPKLLKPVRRKRSNFIVVTLRSCSAPFAPLASRLPAANHFSRGLRGA